MPLRDYITLLRVRQYYKNLLVFLAPFFAGVILNAALWPSLLLAFISLCMVSSSVYIINDIIDAPFDRKSPEKRNRPIASGRIHPLVGGAISLFLLCISALIAISLNFGFLICVLALVVSSFVYTLLFKSIPIADSNFIALNFLVRSISGSYVANVAVSPWLILIVYFFALYLALSKRYGEMLINAIGARKSLSKYTLEGLSGMRLVSLSVAFSLIVFYLFEKHSWVYFVALPFIVYTLFRMHTAYEGRGVLQRDFSRVFTYTDIMACVAIVIALIALSLYFGV